MVRDRGADDARAGYDEPAASHASSSATSAPSRSRSGGRTSGRIGDALPGGHALERGVPRERLHRRAERRQRRRPLLGRIADDRRDLLGERGRERGDGADRTCLATAVDERLRADEDVEPVQQVALERLPRSVRDLHPDDVVGLLPKSRQHRRVERVPGRRGELVDVERERRAGGSRREEVRALRRRVQLEVRRADHGDGVRARLRRVGRQRDGVLRASALRSARPPARARRPPRASARARGGARRASGAPPRRSSRTRAPRRARRPTRKSAYGPNASSSSRAPPSASGVEAAAIAPRRRVISAASAPAPTRSTVAAMRRARVSGRLASSTHSTYSRRCGERELRERRPRRVVRAEGVAQVGGHAHRPRLGVELHLDPDTLGCVDPGRRLHVAVDDDVPDAVVDAGGRAPRVPADRDLHRRARAAERLLEVERDAEHRRRLLHALELHGEPPLPPRGTA